METAEMYMSDALGEAFVIAHLLERLDMHPQAKMVLEKIKKNDLGFAQQHIAILNREAIRRKDEDVLERLQFAGLIY